MNGVAQREYSRVLREIDKSLSMATVHRIYEFSEVERIARTLRTNVCLRRNCFVALVAVHGPLVVAYLVSPRFSSRELHDAVHRWFRDWHDRLRWSMAYKDCPYDNIMHINYVSHDQNGPAGIAQTILDSSLLTPVYRRLGNGYPLRHAAFG